MADLKLLTERVVEKEKSKIRQSVQQKHQEAEEQIEAAREKAKKEKQEQQKLIDKEFQQEYVIKKNTVKIQQRNKILQVKQDILKDIFHEAKYQLKNIDSKTFRHFLSDVSKQFQNYGEIELILGEESQTLVDQEWLNRQDLSNLIVTLKEETVKNESGLLIQKEGIEYNFLFNELVDDIKVEMLPIISKELFN